MNGKPVLGKKKSKCELSLISFDNSLTGHLPHGELRRD
jgi:hypothetical protein